MNDHTMPMSKAELSQKNKVRVAYQAAVMKIIDHLKELCQDDTNTPQVLQRKLALLVKCEIIKRLDGEILDQVLEDEQEPKIERGEEVQEQIEIATMEANNVL